MNEKLNQGCSRSIPPTKNNDSFESLTWQLVMSSHQQDPKREQDVALRLDDIGWEDGASHLIKRVLLFSINAAHPGGTRVAPDSQWFVDLGKRCLTKHAWERCVTDHAWENWPGGPYFPASLALSAMSGDLAGLRDAVARLPSSLVTRYEATIIEVLVDDYVRRNDETFDQALLGVFLKGLAELQGVVERGTISLTRSPTDPQAWSPPGPL